jgi:Uma2 family endonuclease
MWNIAPQTTYMGYLPVGRAEQTVYNCVESIEGTTMSTTVTGNPPLIGWREHFEDNGDGKFDEAWNGVVIMAPLPNDEHQELQLALSVPLFELIQLTRLGKVRPGVNVTDRYDDWRINYRSPDVVVYLKSNPSINNGSHWIGGPDFLIEIISPNEDPLAKLEFYAGIGTREMLTVERAPWALELFKLIDGELVSSGRVTEGDGANLTSETVKLGFSLESGTERPCIRMAQLNGDKIWWA